MIVSKNKNDCYTCALATLLNLKYEDVPYHKEHCENPTEETGEAFFKLRDEWLKEHYLTAICMPWDISKPFPIFSGDSIRCIADLQAENDTHAVVLEVRQGGEGLELEIIYDNHQHNAYLEPKDIINIEFIQSFNMGLT